MGFSLTTPLVHAALEQTPRLGYSRSPIGGGQAQRFYISRQELTRMTAYWNGRGPPKVDSDPSSQGVAVVPCVRELRFGQRWRLTATAALQPRDPLGRVIGAITMGAIESQLTPIAGRLRRVHSQDTREIYFPLCIRGLLHSDAMFVYLRRPPKNQ